MSARAAMLLPALLDDPRAPAIEIRGVCLDSRLVEPGDLYVAVGGASTHGLAHAADAVRRGAVAVAVDPHDVAEAASRTATGATADLEALLADGVALVEVEALAARAPAIAARLHGHPDRALTLVAVTGTDGKTSVCRFVAAALDALGTPCGYVGTLGWGHGEALAATALTTPDALSLQRILAALRDGGARAVALEASSHALATGRLDALALDVAVLTNLGRDHLDFHGDVAAYRRAKARLFDWPSLGTIVVNGDDGLGRELAGRAADASVRRIVYRPGGVGVGVGSGSGSGSGSGGEAPPSGARRGSSDETALGAPDTASDALRIAAKDVRTTTAGLSFTLVDGVDTDGASRHRVDSALMGRFNVDNLLACHGVLRALGHPAGAAAGALGALAPVAGRMERFVAPARPVVIVDFAHTPQALVAALAAARAHCAGELWVVFGCGGDRDPGKRAPMGRAAESGADHVIVTDDNPRTEASADIIDAVLEGMREPARARVVPERAAAIAHAVRAARASDVVLVAGKGHEDYQIVGRTRLPASDRARVADLLAEAC